MIPTCHPGCIELVKHSAIQGTLTVSYPPPPPRPAPPPPPPCPPPPPHPLKMTIGRVGNNTSKVRATPFPPSTVLVLLLVCHLQESVRCLQHRKGERRSGFIHLVDLRPPGLARSSVQVLPSLPQASACRACALPVLPRADARSSVGRLTD